MLQDLEQSRAEPADPKRHTPLCSILTVWLIDFHCCPEEVWHFCSSRLVILLLLLSFLHVFFVSELQGSGPGHQAHGEQLVFVPFLLQLPLLVPANALSSLIYSRSTLTLTLWSRSIVPAALMEGWFLFLSPPFSFVFLFSLLIATTGALLCGTRDCELLISFKTLLIHHSLHECLYGKSAWIRTVSYNGGGWVSPAIWMRRKRLQTSKEPSPRDVH